MIVLIWIVALLAALYLYFRQLSSKFKNNDVKVLNTSPLVDLIRILIRKDHMLTNIKQSYDAFPNERFVGRLELTNPMLILRDLELIKRVTIKDFEYFLDRRGIKDNNSEPLFTRSLLFLRGQEWKDMRSTLSPAFTSSKIRLMVPFMEEIADQMTIVLKEKFAETGDGHLDVDCKDLTTRYANDVIASCAFGLRVNSQKDKNNQFYRMGVAATSFKLSQLFLFLLMTIAPFVFKVIKFSFLPEEMKSFFVDLIQQTMKEREEKHIVRPDMIHLLMQVKKGNLKHDDKLDSTDSEFATVEESMVGKRNVNREWSDIDIVAQAVIFFFAGFETISTAMSFALLELALNPEVQERLVQEIKENGAKHSGKLDYTSIQNMKYLDMVVSEVLRLWPPMPLLDRMCRKESYNFGTPSDATDKEYIMHKEGVVLIPVMSIHRDPRYFPDPKRFDPERFSDETNTTSTLWRTCRSARARGTVSAQDSRCWR